jgi:hypothetical protein
MSCDIDVWRRRLAERLAASQCEGMAAMAERGRSMAGSGMITVARPKPDEVTIAITDADDASSWTSCSKTDLAELGPSLLAFLEDGQRMLHEQRDANPA